MAYLAFVFRYKEPKKYVPCTIGEEKSRDGRAKRWTWLPSRMTQSLSDFGWWKTPFQAKLLGKRRTALVPGRKVFHWKSGERVGNRREFVSLTQVGYDLRWVRDDMVPMTRHIPGSSLSHQQGHRAQKAGEPPKMWRCVPKITLFSFHSTSTHLVSTQHQQSKRRKHFGIDVPSMWPWDMRQTEARLGGKE